MASVPYFNRDFTKINLIDDLIEMFPKLANGIFIPRSNGNFTFGNVLQSNIFKNHYAEWDEHYQSWFIPTIFVDPYVGSMFKFVNINDLSLSYFSWEEIHQIRKALEQGIYIKDMTKVSPDFHPINKDWLDFKRKFSRKNNSPNPNFNPDDYLNIPPLTL
jgi:hypothetical protein